MATCIDDGSLEVNDDGKLEVRICGDPADETYPGGVCSRNLLKSDPDCGLHVRERRPLLRRNFTALGQRAVNLGGSIGPGVGRAANLYTTQHDTGTPLGLWTIRGDGQIQINCAGVYQVTQQTIVLGSTGQVYGGRARVTNSVAPASIIASTEINFYAVGGGPPRPANIDLSLGNDGPEFNASNIRELAVGAILQPISNVYLAAVNQGLNYSGEFTLAYLGERA